jgi:hypothetical protein
MPTGSVEIALLHPDRPHRASVAVRATDSHASAAPLMPSSHAAPAHPVLRLQHLHGNRHVQRLVQEQRSQTFSPPCIARKAAGGGSCSSAPSEEEAAQAEAQTRGQAEEEPAVMAKFIDRAPQIPRIQRYGLVGFPRAEKAKMDAAIPIALDTIENCDDIGWLKTKAMKDTLRSTIYVYDTEQAECGWTYPTAPLIKIGKSAFNPGTCCKLESTLAHEASHVSFSTESGAREMEKDCFGCVG